MSAYVAYRAAKNSGTAAVIVAKIILHDIGYSW